ncbi:SRPBCC family protein [Paraconexibacter antarcticus]|uniref:SRPBCC family protein n=1 Tax=Paraconexibacter antarcticus TaxID=2949664 RepID=A0ABY5DPN0_9ACTN|nr:SRPBCC family protein [Paraconexibacter antarcticus]UTI63574.1 SRPBCC family protein [Paraconexibacter antarcticus]
MIELTQARTMPASPEEVAALVADLERWPEWFALHKGWSGEVPGPARKGLKFKHKVRVLGVAGDVTWEVVEVTPPERFVLKGKGPTRSSMGIDFGIAPRESGSEVGFTASVGGLALRPFEGMLKEWLGVRADRTLDSLHALLAAG